MECVFACNNSVGLLLVANRLQRVSEKILGHVDNPLHETLQAVKDAVVGKIDNSHKWEPLFDAIEAAADNRAITAAAINNL